MKLLHESLIYLKPSSKGYLLFQALMISFVLFMLGYTAAFEFDDYKVVLVGWVFMIYGIANIVITYLIINNGDK